MTSILSSDAHGLAQRPRRVDWVSWALGGGVILIALLLCVLMGFRHKAQHDQEILAVLHKPSRPLRYGQTLPAMQMATVSGRTLTNRDFVNRWTLLVFAEPSCPSCREEIRALARNGAPLGPFVRIVPVLEGRRLLATPRQVAQNFALADHLPFDVALDPDGTVSQACGTADETPHSLLVDPAGRVRLSVGASGQTANGSSKLSDALTSFFLGTASPSMPLTLWRRYQPAPDAPITLPDGTRTSMTKLSQSVPTIVTFLTGNEPFETRRIKAVRRFARSSTMRLLFIARTPQIGSNVRQDHNTVCIVNSTAPLFAAYDRYFVSPGPVSMILYQGRAVLAERGVQSWGGAFEDELDYAGLLSASKSLPRGFGMPFPVEHPDAHGVPMADQEGGKHSAFHQ